MNKTGYNDKKKISGKLAFVNWDCVRNPISTIENDTSGTSRCIERKNGLNSYVHSRSVESLEHNLSHFFTIHFGVQWSFGKKNWMLFRGNAKFVVKSMMPEKI